MCLHSRGSCGWTSYISLLACMSLLLLGGGIFEHLYFRSTDLQNSNAIVQNDFLAIEQKSLVTPPQPTSPAYWKINIRQWAGQLPEKWRKILLDIALSTTLPPIRWTGIIIDGTRWVKEQGKQVNYYDLSTREQIQRSSPAKCIKKEPRQEDRWLSQKA